MASHGSDRDGDDSLPPSCRCVLLALRCREEATRQDLLEATGLPESTLDDALDTLETRDYILKTRESGDLRQVVTKLAVERTVNTPESDRYS